LKHKGDLGPLGTTMGRTLRDIGKALFLFLFWATRGIKKDINNNKVTRKVDVFDK
jgi:hypothetical protein